MSYRTINIELRLDYDDPDKHQAMKDAARMAGQTLMATATLLSERRKPKILIVATDFTTGSEEISLEEPEPISA